MIIPDIKNRARRIIFLPSDFCAGSSMNRAENCKRLSISLDGFPTGRKLFAGPGKSSIDSGGRIAKEVEIRYLKRNLRSFRHSERTIPKEKKAP